MNQEHSTTGNNSSAILEREREKETQSKGIEDHIHKHWTTQTNQIAIKTAQMDNKHLCFPSSGDLPGTTFTYSDDEKLWKKEGRERAKER